ncbi:MAG: hypothetical protein ACRBBR_00740 [Cellvibrionaceae bacterium]
MIDINLIKNSLSLLSLSISDMDKHGSQLIKELQLLFGTCEGENYDSEAVQNFDCFEFAWNRLPKSGRLRIVTLAYRDNKTLFQDVKMDSPVGWGDFTLAQQVELFKASAAMLEVSVTLFSDKEFSWSFADGFKSAIREKQFIADQKAVAEMRGVA